jgi:hypothetical protein
MAAAVMATTSAAGRRLGSQLLTDVLAAAAARSS